MIIQLDRDSFSQRWQDIKALPALRQLAGNLGRAAREGRHILYGRQQLLKDLAALPGLGADEAAGLQYAAGKQFELAEIWRQVRAAVRVTGVPDAPALRLEEANRLVLQVPFTQLTSSESVLKSLLLAEHDDDARVYARLASAWMAATGLGKLQLALERHGCGGGNVASQPDTFLENGRWVLLITDSERKRPGGAEGSTAIAARKVEDRHPNRLIKVKVLEAHELESILPAALVEASVAEWPADARARVDRARKAGFLFESDDQARDLWYLDLKKGLCWGALLAASDDPVLRWRRDVAERTPGCAASALCVARGACVSPERCTCEVVPALGDGLLRAVADWADRTSPRKLEELTGVSRSAVWSELSALVFSSGCAWQPQRT